VQSQVCIPIALVLNCSIRSQPEGERLDIKLLAPRSSWFWPFSRSVAARVVDTQRLLNQESSLTPQDRLKAQLQNGPCSNLQMVQLEFATEEKEKAQEWAKSLMLLAYPGFNPYRKLKVLVNPIGGPGHALRIFEKEARPILEAAGCTLDVSVTQHRNHGTEIVQALPLNSGFDSIVCVSGDGMIYEVLNGLAQRSDANEAMRMPVAPIPAGSGNAIAHNILGPAKSVDLITLACLNIIKGKEMLMNVCTITQPNEILSSHTNGTSSYTNGSTSHENGTKKDSSSTDQSNDSKSYTLHYTFLSQAIGLMADLDLGTESIRALGDVRFLLGYLRGVIFNRECPVDIYVKFGKQGTIEKQEMRRRMLQTVLNGAHPQSESDGDLIESPRYLRNGAVTDPLPEEASIPIVDLRDPSWFNPLLEKKGKGKTQPNNDPDQWYRIQEPSSVVYAGKIPHVAKDALAFPYANPGDDCVDLYIHLLNGGRSGLIRTVLASDTGRQVYDPSMVYMKVETYRIVPRLKAGDSRLIQGGLVSIDGERRPYSSYQVEVHPSLRLRVLSMYGTWCIPDVPPPTTSS
jgi:sphingosine kinase